MVLQNELQKLWSYPQGGNLIFQMTIAQRGAPPWWCKGCWIPLGWPSYLSQKRGSGGNDGEHCSGRSSSHCRHHHRKEYYDQGARTPKEQQRQTGHPQQYATSKSGCKAWRKMLLKWSWEGVMWVIMGLSGGMLILNMWVEVKEGIEDKMPHDYWETPPVDLPLQEEGVPIR